MTATTPEAPKRSLFKLIGELPTLLVNLLRAELDSFKQELAAKLKAAGIGVGLLAAAATFLFFALLVLLTAAIAGLATVLPVWASALIIGVVILVIAVILAVLGLRSLRKGVPPTPENTIESVKQDVRTIRGIGKGSA